MRLSAELKLKLTDVARIWPVLVIKKKKAKKKHASATTAEGLQYSAMAFGLSSAEGLRSAQNPTTSLLDEGSENLISGSPHTGAS